MRKFAFTLLLASLSLPASAWAVLGQYANSVVLDRQELHGKVRELARQGYSVKQITSPSGTVVNEYVSPAGVVFGISWKAPVLPDLEQLLGPYFIEFQQAARSSTRRHGPLVLKTKHLVLVSGGHMRAFRGAAYVPSLVPVHVSAEVVR